MERFRKEIRRIIVSEERKKILGMLAEGKISVEEAERLLSAISESEKEFVPGKKAEGAKKLLQELFFFC